MAKADLLPTRLKEAVTALNNGDLARAASAASSAMALDPENSDCHLIMATVLQNKGDLKQAEHHYIECLRINEKQIRAYINLGMLKLNEGQPDAAVITLETALKVDSGSHEARHYLARAYGMKGDFENSAKEFAKLMKTAGRDIQIIQGYALTLTHLKQYDKALKVLKRADAINPGHPMINQAIASVRTAMGQEKPN